jgi:hypothetical protein
MSGADFVQARRFRAAKALEIGWGGVSQVSDITGLSRKTIDKGVQELENENELEVNVGKSYNTAKFATESIRQWWNIIGKYHYAECKKLLFCADGGGSNGSRSHQDRQRKN